MWLSLGESVRGTSHVESETECQDWCEVSQGSNPDPGALLFALSDGAGSAKHSAIGAKLVVTEFCSNVRSTTITPEAVTRETVIDVVRRIRERITSEAGTIGCDTRELSATLLAGFVSDKASWFVQIGDGAIVIGDNDAYTALTWPTNGEFANSTIFVVSEDWERYCQFVSIARKPREIAAFTDGMQDLILLHANRSVHGPFLRDLFSTMRAIGDPAALAAPLRTFLDSKRVNERTDDDKTLVLSCWID